MIRIFILITTLLITLFSTAQNFSNKGTEFWVGYGYHVRMPGANSQNMVLYLSADQACSATISAPGVGFSTTVSIPGNSVLVSTSIPKTGAQDCRLLADGISNKGIRITSTKPIVAYAHINDGSISGATLLFPTNTLGKEYVSMNFTQQSNEGSSNCFAYAVAVDTGTTTIQVTPSENTLSLTGKQSYLVTLQQGQVYNMMGTVTGNNGVDLTGTKFKSINTGSGCKRLAVFSGSGKIFINCGAGASSADNYMSQCLPLAAWGKNFLTVPPASYPNNFYRVGVLDPCTKVFLNGVLQTGLINNFYYQFQSNTANSITADKPIMVAQYFPTQNTCGGSGVGDPECIYLSPLEQTINSVTLYSANQAAIQNSFVNVIIKNAGVPSFRLDGAAVSGWVAHPNLAGYSYLVRGVTTGAQHTLYSDTGFNAIAYGYGSAESYGYNAGTNVRDLTTFITPINPLAIDPDPSACRNEPFTFSITLPYQPLWLRWNFNGFQTPNEEYYPGPIHDTTYLLNGKQVWRYKLPHFNTYNDTGCFPVRVVGGTLTNEGCGDSIIHDLQICIFNKPIANFGWNHNGCVTDSVRFIDATVSTIPPYKWKWLFGDGGTDSVKNPVYKYSTPGTYTVKYVNLSRTGCFSDTISRTITITDIPIAKFNIDSPLCVGRQIQFLDSSFTNSPADTLASWLWTYGDGSMLDSALTRTPPRTHAYGAANTYTANLYVRTNSGCPSLPVSKTFTVGPYPVANFTVPAICLPPGSASFTNSTAISDGTLPQVTYGWNFGDPASGINNTSNLQNPVHIFTSAMPYNVTLSATSNLGCKHDTVKTVSTIFNQPTPNYTFTPASSNNCDVNYQFTTTAAVGSATDPISNYFWDFGDPASGANNTSSANNPSHIFTSPGIYTVKHWVRTANGCGGNDTATNTITISPLPIAKFGISTINCATQNISFTDSSTSAGTAITEWTWNFGDATMPVINTTNATVNHIYAAAGNYTATLVVKTAGNSCTSIVFTKNIVVNPKPTAAFTLPGNVCLPVGAATFTDNSSVTGAGQTITNWNWSFGDANTSILQNPTHNYASTGPFNIKLKITTNNGCIDSTEQVLNTVYNPPTASFTVLPENCLNDTTKALNTSTDASNPITQWNWNFGDGNLYNTLHANNIYASAGNYNITLSVTNNKGCVSAPVTQQVVINPLPTAVFGFTNPTCEQQAINITDTSIANAGSLTSWQWNMGDLSPVINNSGGTFNYTYTNWNNYFITLNVATNKGCKASISKPISINPLPKTNFIAPDVCLSDAFAQFLDSTFIADNSEAGFTYAWNFGDALATPPANPNTSTLKDPTHRYSAIGNYTATLTVTSNKGCVVTKQKSFTVNGDIPVANFTIENTNGRCANQPIEIINTSTVNFGSLTRVEVYWNWPTAPLDSTVDEFPAFNEVYSHSYPDFQTPTTKTYNIRIRSFSGGTCISEITKTITINASPKVVFAPINNICVDAAIKTFTEVSETSGLPGTGVYTGPGVVGNTFNAAVAGVGTHTIRYTFNANNGCTTFQERTITVTPRPVANFGISASACENNAVSFVDSSTSNATSITNWLWNFGDGSGNINTSSTPFNHTFNTANNFTVSLAVTNNNGCVSLPLTKLITVNPKPKVNFAMPTICMPSGAGLFTSTTPAIPGSTFTYAWTFGDGGTSMLASPTHTYTGVGVYNVSLKVTATNGCDSTTTKVYTDIHPQPIARINPLTIDTCVNTPIRLLQSSNGLDGTITNYNWNWGNGSSNSFTMYNPPVTKIYNSTGNYLVKLNIVNSFGCVSANDSLIVRVNPYPTISFNPSEILILENDTLTLNPILTNINNPVYLWSPSTYLNSATIRNPQVTGINDITYTLRVTDRGGCATTSSGLKVTVLKTPVIPNTFTPNNDGVNDIWEIKFLEFYKNARIKIFNRYGQPVWESLGYAKPWDGKMKGQDLPPGTYYYVIEPGNKQKNVTGYVTILR
jgi:gliding motility-associated-like protein